ncbi:MAG: hypothetical protein WC437_02480 [Patescibacteria group bacterium]
MRRKIVPISLKFILTIVALVTMSSFFMLPKNAQAAQNPSYIMPDDVFVNAGSMSEQQIQDFLVARGSYLASYTIPVAFTEAGYYNGTWIGPIGAEVDSTGWSAAHVIYTVSQWYGINPQVIMATLFKEQSWITSQDPTYDIPRRLRWAMGYAVTESGVVNVCGTGTNHNPSGSCAGLAMQVDWGAGGLKYSYNGSQNKSAGVSPYWAGNTINLETAIYIGNHSTAALYRYTPHTPYSSNYVWFFNTYFGNIDYTGGRINVYRFRNINGYYFYTIFEAEKNNIIAKWPNLYIYEGVNFSLNYGSNRNSVPLYRFYNKQTGSHFYTAFEAEKNDVIAKYGYIYQFEGTAWNVSYDPANSFPVYRFYNLQNGSHFYTANEGEKNTIISTLGYRYRFEGVSYYVPN